VFLQTPETTSGWDASCCVVMLLCNDPAVWVALLPRHCCYARLAQVWTSSQTRYLLYNLVMLKKQHSEVVILEK